MLIAIGSAFVLPAIPASGAESAPVKYIVNPISAAAEPGTSPLSCNARAIAFGITRPTLATTTNIPASKRIKPLPASTDNSTTRPPIAEPGNADSEQSARTDPVYDMTADLCGTHEADGIHSEHHAV